MTRRDGSEGGGVAILLIENSSALAILIGRVENLWPPIDSRTDPRSDSRAFHRHLPPSLSVSLHCIGFISENQSFASTEGIKLEARWSERRDSAREKRAEESLSRFRRSYPFAYHSFAVTE